MLRRLAPGDVVTVTRIDRLAPQIFVETLNFWTKESGALRGVRVRLLRLTCRVADRPAPPEMTQTGLPPGDAERSRL